MRTRYGLAVLLLLALAPPRARAQAEQTPEQLLPAGAQVYLRWDGIAAHRADYARTALGKTLQGDTGTFVTGLFSQIQDGVGSLLTIEQLLSGVPPEKLQQLQKDAAAASKLPGLIGQNGFALAVEVRSLETPQGSVTLVLPGLGDAPAPAFGALRLVAHLAKAPLKEQKIDGRAVTSLAAPGVTVAWWAEGKHVVLRAGTDSPEALVKAVAGKGERLTGNPLYKRVTAFKTFRTNARAYVDLASFVKLAGTAAPAKAPKGKDKEAPEAPSPKAVVGLLRELGLDGLKSVVAYSGFDGEAERGLVEADMPGPRKGLLSLFKGKAFTLADVPPLPPDVVSWSVTNLDLAGLYDAGLKAAEAVVRVIAPDAAGAVPEYVKKANALLGVDLRKDLLGALGDRFATYTAPSDGPLFFGQTVLLKVKDAAKLEAGLDQLVKGLAKLAGADVRVRKRTYRGVLLREVIVRQQGFFFRPTYALHEGWLVVSAFPQPVQGYVGRAKGELRAWKPSERVKESLGRLPAEFVSVTYSDPRPGLKQLLSIAPIIGGLVDSLNPDLNFDVGSIPGAQEATRHLFPNLSVSTDDGRTVRLESRAALPLPFDLTGIDTYSLFIGLLLPRLAG
jgi:hypothetical protein